MMGRSVLRPGAAIDIDAKVSALESGRAFGDSVGGVEIIETHMAYVFLTERYAYKLKKPVRYPYLDYSTLAARRWACEEEIRLNRRLAADVYLGVVPLTADVGDVLRVGGDGEVVDVLVKMRRLPRQRMLDHCIARDTVTDTDIRTFARVLVEFYRHAAPVAVAPATYVRRFRDDIIANRDSLRSFAAELPLDDVQRLTDSQMAFVDRHSDWLIERALTGRIIEAHGDLRPEHICLGPTPVVIDSLEFDRDMRLLDPADELAYLALECDRLGAPSIGRIVFDEYGRTCDDLLADRLMPFYYGFRAVLRAKIAIWHTEDRTIDDHSRWIERARQYLFLGGARTR